MSAITLKELEEAHELRLNKISKDVDATLVELNKLIKENWNGSDANFASHSLSNEIMSCIGSNWNLVVLKYEKSGLSISRKEEGHQWDGYYTMFTVKKAK